LLKSKQTGGGPQLLTGGINELDNAAQDLFAGMYTAPAPSRTLRFYSAV